MLSVTVLGCSGSYASATEACSGYLVSSGTTKVWVDCGPGTLAAIQQHIDLGDVDAIVVTHQHPDHCGELPVLYNALKWYIDLSGLPVYAPSGVREVTDVFVDDSSDVFEWTTIDATSEVRVGDIDIRFDRTDHTVETLACRFETGGNAVVYTADTGPGWDLSKIAAGVDVLIGDATVVHADLSGGSPHLSARQLAEAADRANVGHLVLTHLAPGSDPERFLAEADRYFDGPVSCASGGMVIRVGDGM